MYSTTELRAQTHVLDRQKGPRQLYEDICQWEGIENGCENGQEGNIYLWFPVFSYERDQVNDKMFLTFSNTW